MRWRVRSVTLPLVMAILLAQETSYAPRRIEYLEIEQHRLTRLQPLRMAVPPRYAARVRVHMLVDASGDVVTATPFDGPSRLYQPAVDQIKRVKYRPFESEGKPVRAEFDEELEIWPLQRFPEKHVPFPEISDRGSVRVTLSRRNGFSMEPAYRVVIAGDGVVLYEGTANVAISGRHISHISADRVDELLNLLRKADYFSLDETYRYGATDQSTYVTATVIGDNKKSVVDYSGELVGMPHVVTELEDAIDRIAETAKWLRSDKQTLPALEEERFDFHSKEAAQMLVACAAHCPAPLIREMLQRGVPVDATDQIGDSPLSSAAGRKDKAILGMLIAAGSGKHDGHAKAKALLAACWNGKDMEIVRMLLDYGADPNIRSPNDQSVLTAAASNSTPEIVAEILKHHPKADESDENGKTALFNVYDATIARMLIAAGANVNAVDSGGYTPLHMASKPVADVLIAAGANVNARNRQGETPLMTNFREDVLELLIQSGADFSIHNNNGRTAFDYDERKKAVIERHLKH